jgi:uncharacterized membrane protein HdeD (DUF308 family)
MAEVNLRAGFARDVAQHSGTYLALGAVLVGLGIVAIVTPLVAGVATVYALGSLLVASGVFRCAFAFRAESWGAGVLGFALGALALLAGSLVIAQPVLALASLTLLLAIYFAAHGAVEAVVALRLRPDRPWVWALVSGVISIVLAFMIAFQWPTSALWVVGLLLGIHLISAGSSLVGIASASRRIERTIRRHGGSPGT